MRAIAEAILKTPALEKLPERIDAGALPVLVSGLMPIHRTTLAAAMRYSTGQPIFAICPDETSAEALAKELGRMLGEAVAELGSRDYTFYSADVASREAEQKRLAALYSLLREESGVTICSTAGLLQRTIPPAKLEAAAIDIDIQGVIKPEELEARLLDIGYIRSSEVEGPGQFARRGGILDFFSPAHQLPVRIEFWGDEIDSMGFFEVSSQRRAEQITSCRLLPASETLPSAYPGGIAALADEIDALSKSRRLKGGTEKLRATLREDAERLRHAGHLTAADRYIDLIYGEKCTALDYIPPDALVFLMEPGHAAERGRGYIKTLGEDVRAMLEAGSLCGQLADFAMNWEEAAERLGEFAVIMADAFTLGRYPLEPRSILNLSAKQLPSYSGSAEAAADDVQHMVEAGYGVVILASDERRAEYMRDILENHGVGAYLDLELTALPTAGRAAVARGSLSAGFELPEIKFAVLTDAQILSGGYQKVRRRRAANRERLGSYSDLSPGDLVVHEYHGIGRFVGIFKIPVDGIEKDYIKIAYSGADALYVPATQLDLVSKYIGSGGEDKPVRLSRMGGADWSRAKTRAKGAAKELAKGLIELYAERQRIPGHAFAPDTPWQTEFEDRFGYRETDDQLRSIDEIKEDMEKQSPMDRLLCGDVGYGKTEVALRAVMKCVMDNKQAAILVPTTVLAQQHYQTAMARFFGYPLRIEVLSRFRTPAQVKDTLRNLQSGSCDIVIGTHRLIQKDIKFKSLGLLIIDEEQRFGVSHKERLKEMSRGVDVLTLSATPIPRTLNMAMSGIRDMSMIEEPPQDRLPVQTFVMEHDWGVVCDAIRREVNRGGQVYYLHNRVDNIERTALRLADMLEGVSVSVAHGKMDEESLSVVMEKMTTGECQLLVCTTIIETGIDIPNVNTLVIEDADKLGLAQLHQIRGRVGRSTRRASAYLTFRRDKVLTEVAEKRLSAIREFAEFNSGFKIAMRDLEIRGAGNLLGAEQSGHMISVGYDMYLKLLEEAVLEERGEKPEVRAECAADLAVSANIPEGYVESAEQRMDLYRRIALIRTEEEADDLTDELIDRFGDPPPAVNSLVHIALLRGEATRAGISDISQKSGYLKFVVTDFNMEKVSVLYEQKPFKGRVKVEAGTKPCLSLRLGSSKRILDEARSFVASYREAGAGSGASEPA